jgi:hypothetical protein
MHSRGIPVLVVASFALFTSSRAFALNPLTQEERTVHVVSDAARTVTVPEGMVWYDDSPPTHGIRFPPGIYVLEAEDADYWFLRSPSPLEFRIFKDGKAVDGHSIPGGLMVSKHPSSLLPGAGYIDDSSSKKMMIWKLGAEFIRLRGRYWKPSF